MLFEFEKKNKMFPQEKPLSQKKKKRVQTLKKKK